MNSLQVIVIQACLLWYTLSSDLCAEKDETAMASSNVLSTATITIQFCRLQHKPSGKSCVGQYFQVRYPSLELNSEEQINSVVYTKFGYDVNTIIILIIAWLKNCNQAWKRILWKTTSSSWPQSPYKLKIDSQKP